ncbi:hypothetical protein AVEN_81803-1 [Araneus ventricosus]|uniref:DUF7041 domain-containing protein n=1 Tax=Araneus ventricosus TaxID=182803 RepID=A0A4Y2N6Q1_ARAVE|nr:hypothetical protein AVEN_81803-1 [Araneus ventricosus]
MPEATKPELARVAFRALPFWETDLHLWFLQLESQFKLSGISIDETKFHMVVAALDSKILSYVSDTVRNPLADSKYDALKTQILSHFPQSQGTKLRVLLQDLQLGHKKPSELLQEMRNLAVVSEDVLRTIWMQRLPTTMQQILSVSNDNLDELSLIANKVKEVSHFSTVVNSVASDNLVIQSFREEISELRAELKRISLPRFRQSSRGKLKDSSVSEAADRSHTHRPLAHTPIRIERFETGLDIPFVVYREQLELAHVPAPAKNRSAFENCHCPSPTSSATGGSRDTCKPTGACTHADFSRSTSL